MAHKAAMRGCIALEFGAWHVAGPGNQILVLDSYNRSTGQCSRHRRRKFMIKAILNGSVDHNMRDGCSTKTGRCVFSEEALLEIMVKSRSCLNVFRAFENCG